MITTLTPEQEQKMVEVRQYWLDYIFSCKNSLDRTKTKAKIEWLYKFCGLDAPIVIFLESPAACQIGANLLRGMIKVLPLGQVASQVRSQVRSQVESQVESQVASQVRSQVESQVESQVRSQVRSQVWSQVASQVRSQVASQVRSQEFIDFGSYANIYSYGWVSFYDFFTQIGVVDDKGFNQFKSLLECGIYDTIQLDGCCFVCGLPEKLSRNSRNQLHCEDGPAIQFRDGYAQYYWNGVSVPEFWITDKDRITKEIIASEDNAERRRCLREIIGPSKYFELLGGVIEVDRDTDDQGNEMVLYRSKKKDDIINKHIQYLSVICPSTRRQYILYPPNQKSKNVWAAKASTFRGEKIQVRHGDVGLLNLQKEFSKPILES